MTSRPRPRHDKAASAFSHESRESRIWPAIGYSLPTCRFRPFLFLALLAACNHVGAPGDRDTSDAGATIDDESGAEAGEREDGSTAYGDDTNDGAFDPDPSPDACTFDGSFDAFADCPDLVDGSDVSDSLNSDSTDSGNATPDDRSSDATPSDADSGTVLQDDDAGIELPRPCAAGSPSNTRLLDVPRAGSGGALSSTRYATFAPDHWSLWDTSSGQRIALGAASCPTGLQPCGILNDQIMLVAQATGLAVHDPRNGQHRSTVTRGEGATYGAARDGSYFWTADAAGVALWSSGGGSLGRVTGDYSAAVLSAEPGVLRVANGPAGPQRIESITLPGLNRTNSTPFEGVFERWFKDGQRFLTSSEHVLSVYSSSTLAREVRQELMPWEPGTVGGKGDYYWMQAPLGNVVDGGDFYIYRVGSGSASIAHVIIPFASPVLSAEPIAYSPHNNPSLIYFPGLDGTIRWLRLHDAGALNLAFNDRGDLAVQSSYGSIYFQRADEPVKKYGLGTVLDADLSTSGRWAAGFSVGKVFIGEIANPSILLAIDFNVEVRPETIFLKPLWTKLTPDGTRLAVMVWIWDEDSGERFALRVYDATTARQLREWTSSPRSMPPRFELSDVQLAREADGSPTPGPPRSVISDVLGDNTAFTIEPSVERILLSPRGTYVSATRSIYVPNGPNSALYDAHGNPLHTLPGAPVAWLDDQRLLLQARTEPYGLSIVAPNGTRLDETPLTAPLLANSTLQRNPYDEFRSLRGGSLLFWDHPELGGILDLAHDRRLWAIPPGGTLAHATDEHVLYYDRATSALCLATPAL